MLLIEPTVSAQPVSPSAPPLSSPPLFLRPYPYQACTLCCFMQGPHTVLPHTDTTLPNPLTGAWGPRLRARMRRALRYRLSPSVSSLKWSNSTNAEAMANSDVAGMEMRGCCPYILSMGGGRCHHITGPNWQLTSPTSNHVELINSFIPLRRLKSEE